MLKPKMIGFGLIALITFVLLACEQTNAPKNDEVQDYNAELMQAFDDEIGIVYGDSLARMAGDAMFSLSWSKIKTPIRIFDFEIGHAMAIAFDGSAEKGFMRFGGLDMGDLTLEMPGDTLDLNGINGHGGSYVYLSTPKTNGRGRHGFDNFNFSLVPFIANSDYTFHASGSDEFDALDVTINTPESLITINNLASGDSISTDQDLVINWQGANAESHILIALLPFNNPFGNPDKYKRGQFRGRRGALNFDQRKDLIRLKFKDHPAFVTRLDANDGTFTIPAADVKDLVEAIDAKSLVLHVAAIDFENEEINSKVINKLIRMNDRVILGIK
jgi:hypothetical protein